MTQISELTEQEHQVMGAIAQDLGLDPEKLTPDLDLVEDLNLQPFELVDVAVALSERFGVELSLKEATRWKSVIDIVRSVTEGGILKRPEEVEAPEEVAL